MSRRSSSAAGAELPPLEGRRCCLRAAPAQLGHPQYSENKRAAVPRCLWAGTCSKPLLPLSRTDLDMRKRGRDIADPRCKASCPAVDSVGTIVARPHSGGWRLAPEGADDAC